jgi:SpoVK/Ycf46/Vps4 family AAA+-type ATPase
VGLSGTSVCPRALFESYRSWNKDHNLWVEVQKADWADVILDEEFKDTLQKDVDNFFKSEHVYKDLAIPWKRGIMFLGPP